MRKYLLMIVWLGFCSCTARAEDWTKPELKCVPTVTDYDRFGAAKDGIFAIVWWCDLPDGLHTNWFTGRVLPTTSDISRTIAAAGRDPLLLDQLMVRKSSDAEIELVREIEATHNPRCYVTGSGKTTNVLTSTAQYTIGPPKLDASGTRISVAVGNIVLCYSTLPKETEKRYCNAMGSPDTKGRAVTGDAWVPCRLERAPTEGWQ